MPYVLDHIEWKYGFRCDGISASINSITGTLCVGLASGVMNFFLARSGYLAPEFDSVTGITTGFVQNAATQNVITVFFLGVEIVTALILIGILVFLTVEKVIDKEQAEIQARNQSEKRSH